MEKQKKILFISVAAVLFVISVSIGAAVGYFLRVNPNILFDKSYKNEIPTQNTSPQKFEDEQEGQKEDIVQKISQQEYTSNRKEVETNITVIEDAYTIKKGDIDWREPKSIGDLGYIKDSCDVLKQYFFLGEINSGEYKGYNMYTIEGINSCEYGGAVAAKMLIKDEEKIFFNGKEAMKQWAVDSLGRFFQGNPDEDLVVAPNILIEELVYPETFTSRGEVFYERKYLDGLFTDASYDILQKAFELSYGTVWVTDRAKADQLYADKESKTDEDRKNYGIFNGNAFYIKALDGSVVQYELQIPLFSSENADMLSDVLQVTWDDGTRNAESYEKAPGGCGLQSYVYDKSPDIDVARDLVRIGKGNNGEILYGFQSTNHAEFQVLYNTIYWVKSGEGKKNQEEFLKMHPQVFWVDPFGRVLSFYRMDIISPAECGKPVIYLYPEETTDVHVQVFPGNGFTITDPVYGEDGWHVQATPEGMITNYSDGKAYSYLFWEGKGNALYEMPERGFVVKNEDLENFFAEKLALLGLNAQESFDFQEFWISELREEEKPYYFITFLSEGFIHTLAPLEISPQPDTVVRILMDYEGLDTYKEVEEQSLQTPARKGFTVVEWGGMFH